MGQIGTESADTLLIHKADHMVAQLCHDKSVLRDLHIKRSAKVLGVLKFDLDNYLNNGEWNINTSIRTAKHIAECAVKVKASVDRSFEYYSSRLKYYESCTVSSYIDAAIKVQLEMIDRVRSIKTRVDAWVYESARHYEAVLQKSASYRATLVPA